MNPFKAMHCDFMKPLMYRLSETLHLCNLNPLMAVVISHASNILFLIKYLNYIGVNMMTVQLFLWQHCDT